MSDTHLRFVVHEHHATNLHWDFRLEMPEDIQDSASKMILKSWAVPKGPPEKAKEKRLAVQTPDHAIEYIDFEGEIEEGNYGAGNVSIWDNGTYTLEMRTETEYKFTLHGKKLTGPYALFHPNTFQKKQFLFMKHAAK
ncbi:MAG: 3'-phosphoesterase [Candidatus Roizmanbacteria bacterium]|nr:3'-phosphoesterase [Candidatus Roizmanbacteria bacterium]